MSLSLRQQIELKNGPSPYQTLASTVKESPTNHFLFPYDYYWKSNPLSYSVKIDPRRAGWAPRIDPYVSRSTVCDTLPIETPIPGRCFQTPCNTVFPCKGSCNLLYI